MQLLDLFEIARRNGDALRAQYDRGPEVAEFWRVVDRESTVSINLRISALRGFMARREYLNHSQLEGGKLDFDPLEKSQRAFENGFSGGASFKYGSLYLKGSAGACHYGNFCLVLRQSWSAACINVAFLPQDSAVFYLVRDTDGLARLHEVKIRQDASDWKGRAHLAACKLGATVAKQPPGEWPRTLAHQHDYIEAIMDSPIGPEDCDSVGLPRDDKLWQLLRESYAKLDAGEPSLLSEFKQVLETLDGNRIPVERI